MKFVMNYKIFGIFFLAIFAINTLHSQSTQSDKNRIILKNDKIIECDTILFKSNNFYYFQLLGKSDYYKINCSNVMKNIDCKSIESDKASFYLDKFSNWSLSGIGTCAIGTLCSTIFALMKNGKIGIALGGGITVYGFILWYKAHKYFNIATILLSAVEYQIE